MLSLFDSESDAEPDRAGVTWGHGSLVEANDLLHREHYLGPLRTGGNALIFVGRKDHRVVACQVWRRPTSRNLPADGTWLELSRWCLTAEAGPNAGSRCHRAVLPALRELGARTVVSYSDPSAGHTGALYRACNWLWAPTWLRLRPPPTANGDWGGVGLQAVKDRWIFHVARRDPARSILPTDDHAAVRYWLTHGTDAERKWAAASPYLPT
jgi:hypothetical protein